MAKEKLNWRSVNANDLPKSTIQAYGQYTKAYNDVLRPARQKFEAAFEASARKAGIITGDQELRFSYAYAGRVGVAVVEKTGEKKSGGFDTGGMR